MVHPAALAVYLESLASDKRVAVIGDASLGVAERIADLGARIVEIWDPDDARARTEAANAPPGVVVRSFPRAEAEVRPSAFDLALVTDLAMFDDARRLLSLVRRAVGDRGVAVIVAANREAQPDGTSPASPERGRHRMAGAFDYYELFDLVVGEFDQIRMVAQLPFHGIALAELGREDDPASVSVDMQLADGDRVPHAFVVVASHSDVSLEPYAIVEVPAAAVPPDSSTALDDAVAAVVQAQLRADAFSGQLDDERSRLALVERASAVAVEAQAEQLRERTAQLAEMERSVARRAQQVADLAAEVEEMRSAAEAGRIAASQVEEIALRASRAEQTAATLESEMSRVAEAHAVELGRFEAALRERAQAVRLLETEVALRERLVRDLVETVEEAGRRETSTADSGTSIANDSASIDGAADALAEENGRLKTKLDALALELARREGDVQASAWKVAELERRLGQVSRSPPEAPRAQDQDGRLLETLEELDALRQAMAQEPKSSVRRPFSKSWRRSARKRVDTSVSRLNLRWPAHVCATRAAAEGPCPGDRAARCPPSVTTTKS
jgi:hypothetical protein